MPRARLLLIALFPALFLATQPVTAQQKTALLPGMHVRVWHTDTCCRNPQLGTLVAVSTDSVVVSVESAPAGAARLAVSRYAILSLESSRQVGTQAGKGAGLGIFLGGLIGILGYSTVCSDSCAPDFRPAGLLFGGSIGGLLGVGVGYQLGKARPRLIWECVALP